MASGNSRTIEEIDNMVEMVNLIKTLGISHEGLETLEQMRARVRTALDSSVEKPSWTAGQVRILQKCD